jgi:hypothetical protein
MPPIFRIMGGHGRRNSSQQDPAQQQTPAPAPPSQTSAAPPSSNNRYTYPGMRASGAPQPPATMPGRLPPPGTTPVPPAPSSGGVRSVPAAAPSTAALPGSSSHSTGTANGASRPGGSTRPGAYHVTRTTTGPAIVYRVTIPPGIQPGAEFHVHAGPRRVRVRCPPTSRPGQSLQITLPPEPVENQRLLKAAPLTSATGQAEGGSVAMTPEVAKVNQQAEETGGSARSYLVDIPSNVFPGQSFTVNVAGQRFMVTCPATAGPNMKIRIVPPTVREEPEAAPKTQVFEVSVPQGVRSGQPFALVANGQRVLVTCPPNVVPGQKIRFQLPVAQVVSRIQLAYESNVGWKRTIRVSDMKFQWVRLDNEAPEEGAAAIDVESMGLFDFKKSAYVRKITYLEGNDARMRTGRVSLIPANEAVVDSRLQVNGRTLLSYADIAEQQEKGLEEKSAWFHNICSQLTSAWEDGRIKMVVRHQYLLHDSVAAVMALSREDMRKRWRVEFLGSPGIDVGGLSREWFQLVTEQIFDPAFGLFTSSVNNQMSVEINPASGTSYALACGEGGGGLLL